MTIDEIVAAIERLKPLSFAKVEKIVLALGADALDKDENGQLMVYFGVTTDQDGNLTPLVGKCPNCESEGHISDGCPSCPGFWYE